MIKSKEHVKQIQDRTITLNSPISHLNGIGSYYTRILKTHNINKVRDLLWILPKVHCKLIVSAVIGDHKSFNLTITKVSLIHKPRKITKLEATDINSKTIKITFFSHSKMFYKGAKLTVHGDIDLEKMEMTHPEWAPGHRETFTKIQYSIQDVPSAILHKICLQSITLIQSPHLEKFKINLEILHRSEDQDALKRARNALMTNEALAYQYAAYNANKELAKIGDEYKMHDHDISDIINNFGHELTACQKSAWEEIRQDLTSKQRMVRILYGDVGSGKTLIAALAIALCYRNGHQGVLLVPTEILAQQHYGVFKKLLNDSDILLLTSSTRSAKILDKIRSQPCIIIGTHALLQESVEYYSLRLLIVDEQHRFGVLQRMHGATYNTLVMTATPIPRTFQLSSTGIIPISKLLQRPQGHRDLRTFIVPKRSLHKVFDRIEEALDSNDNIFWVCPFIEESRVPGMNVKARLNELADRFEVPIASVHGQMTSKAKQEILHKFYNRETRILVSTTVIEVGIDVPHANTIIIENAELFGIAQLYQLMGRVGRGASPGQCFFIYDKLPKDANLRLRALQNCKSGIELAEQDLYIRGFGELLGTQQSGQDHLKLVSSDNYELFNLAQEILEQNLDNPDFIQEINALRDIFNYLQEPWKAG